MRLRIALMLLGLLSSSDGRAATGSITYDYDILGRVVTAYYSNNGVCVVYAYDPNGNRTSQTISASTAVAWPLWGTASWGNFNWTSAPESPIWNSGLWGCFLWQP